MIPTPEAAEQLKLARVLYDDAATMIAATPSLLLELDLALASLEFERALGESRPAKEAFRRALDILRGSRNVEPWLYGGAAHVGWTAVHLSRSYGVLVGGLEPLDRMIMEWVADFPEDRDVDLPLGLLGLGVYGLIHPDEGLRERVTAEILRVIEKRVEHDEGIFVRLTAWEPRVRRSPHLVGQRDLGVAHGNAGLVSYLASAAMSGLACAPHAARLLDLALNWFLGQRSDVEQTVFSQSVEFRYMPARSAWCYGDPGIALALSVAARATDRADLRTVARETARSATDRPVSLTRVSDACVCHGASGMAWFNHRSATEFGLVQARDGVAHWTRHIAEQREKGPLEYNSLEQKRRDASFLEGDLGTSLVLLYLATGVRPLWEQRLLATPVVAGEPM
ncbi:lanthionine synthetase LanC family protein [Streptomyces sp. 2P-4]|uniref:lanthionine synthetase LanC family protein n=1 Tax=Streptomyces sp. 2P-4 TaxID=2931974 RepID=UPI0025417D47|nr:lanthionine synthetase LanC family protein [Streptomyces sp. 2P-4]